MSLKNLHPQPTRSIAPMVHNEAGGNAYVHSAERQLVKLMLTGMTSDTYYVKAESVNDKIFELAKQVEPSFLAKLLVYARTSGNMRSNPIQLLVYLSVVDPALFRKVRAKVLHNGGDVLDFGTVIFGGQVRQGWGKAPRQEIAKWFNDCDAYQIIKYGSDKQNPSLADILKVTHPVAKDPERNALFRWLLGKEVDTNVLPEKVRAYLEFAQLATKDTAEAKTRRLELLATTWLPHEYVSSFKLSDEEWSVLSSNMPIFATVRSLNTFSRHNVFNSPAAVKHLADKISNEEVIAKSKMFPYRFLTAFLEAEATLPQSIKTALGKALEVATRNVPIVDGLVVVAPDVSGSMGSSVSAGDYGSNRPPSKTRCIDVAALVSAVVLRKNPDARVIPFDTQNHRNVKLDANDTIMTNASKLSSLCGGGTDVSLPFQYILDNNLAGDLKLLVAVTDNESWAGHSYRNTTGSMVAWNKIRTINPKAQCILINVTPYTSDQLKENTPGITFVSGFSDEVFKLMANVVDGQLDTQIETINQIAFE
jgi:60 kDa SS-A/Ro ribonucleoprotein